MKNQGVSIGDKQITDLKLDAEPLDRLELSRRMFEFVMYAQIFGLKPVQHDDSAYDIRVKQPGGDTANISLGLSVSNDARAVKIEAAHKSGMHSVYELASGGREWFHRQHKHGKPMEGSDSISHIDMIEDMLEYTGYGGETDRLQDTVVANTSETGLHITSALFNDLRPRAHQASTLDRYSTQSFTLASQYLGIRAVDLTRIRTMRSVTDTLTVTSDLEVYPAVNVTERLFYTASRDTRGGTKHDRLQIYTSSTDGVPLDQLRRMARSSTTTQDPLAILNKNLALLMQEIPNTNAA